MNRLPVQLLLASSWLTLSTVAYTQPYTFSTPIGSATNPGSSDGTNSNAQFTSPKGLALDPATNLFLVDGNALREISSSGTNWTVVTVAGSIGEHSFGDGTNLTARFNDPQGVATDPGGNIYIADTYNNAIRKVVHTGTNWVVTTIAGPMPPSNSFGTNDGTNFAARFHNPYGIAVDSATNLYVADSLNNTIRKITPLGTNWVVITLAGLAGTSGTNDASNSLARFNTPVSVAADSIGSLYVADFNNDTIRKMSSFETNWAVSTLAGLAGLRGAANGLGTNARFFLPQCIAVDGAQNLFVTDSGNNTIRKITPAGFVSTLAGTPGVTGSANGTGSAVQFNQPYGIAVDAAGNLDVADFLGYAIRRGQLAALLQISGSGPSLVLSWPMGLTGYVPVFSASLAPASWAPLPTNGLVLTNEYFFLGVSTTVAPQRFFRLQNQSP
jgi:hypothetical protein